VRAVGAGLRLEGATRGTLQRKGAQMSAVERMAWLERTVVDAALIHTMGFVSDGQDDRWVKSDHGAPSNRSSQKRPAIR